MEQAEIDRLIETTDRRAVFINQVSHAKDRFRMLNVLAWEGHIFELTPEFCSYVILQFTLKEACILLDKNDEPVLINDLSEFVEQMGENHTEALNEYHDSYQRLKLAKTTEELIEVA
jgi:hypothetical protein